MEPEQRVVARFLRRLCGPRFDSWCIPNVSSASVTATIILDVGLFLYLCFLYSQVSCNCANGILLLLWRKKKDGTRPSSLNLGFVKFTDKTKKTLFQAKVRRPPTKVEFYLRGQKPDHQHQNKKGLRIKYNKKRPRSRGIRDGSRNKIKVTAFLTQ